MVGEEYGRIYAWGAPQDNSYDVTRSTPCRYTDLPQSLMEPVLVKYAQHHNFDAVFNNELIDVKRTEDGLVGTVKNLLTGQTYQIRTKCLFGADGGRSTVGRAFPFTYHRQPSGGSALNILFNADLGHLMHGRDAGLHGIVQPDRKWRAANAAVLRMVRPYTQWLYGVIATGQGPSVFENITAESSELREYIHEAIGDDSVPFEILRVDKWTIRETVAESFSDGNDVFLIGDAAHRHPPAYGLGSNTCIQDAYNLGWKVAYVHRGLAGKGLLQSYSAERQPVGADLVKNANEGLRDHARIFSALGMDASTAEEGMRQLSELHETSEAGAQRRKLLHEALEVKKREGQSIGIGMNQWYDSSNAVYTGDEPGPRPELPAGADVVTTPLITTYPGMRLPHAWLDTPTKRKEISTQDLAGHGSFCLITGRGGEAWVSAAARVSEATGIPLRAYSIGFGLDYHDVYRQWYSAREVEDDGCVLVRPDRFVAWRSPKIVEDCETKLREVLDKVLDRASLVKGTST
jgi:2-polyprenyl-6-methoxyphenol hydroxylase-like FAD-dependent oxidoreductase